jgi:hypothetical protein
MLRAQVSRILRSIVLGIPVDVRELPVLFAAVAVKTET